MAKGKHVPVRRCVACGERLPKGELVRIVRTVSGRVEVDPTGKNAGRGAYLCPPPKEGCWNLGLSKGRLEHVLRSPLVEGDREALVAYFRQLKSARIGDTG